MALKVGVSILCNPICQELYCSLGGGSSGGGGGGSGHVYSRPAVHLEEPVLLAVAGRLVVKSKVNLALELLGNRSRSQTVQKGAKALPAAPEEELLLKNLGYEQNPCGSH
ncbi:hypothetical protein QOT17_017525 [Balamuthia mandrillaris]